MKGETRSSEKELPALLSSLQESSLFKDSLSLVSQSDGRVRKYSNAGYSSMGGALSSESVDLPCSVSVA